MIASRKTCETHRQVKGGRRGSSRAGDGILTARRPDRRPPAPSPDRAANTLRGWAVVTMTAAFRKTKRFIKQTPPLWRAFSKARAMARRLTRGAGR